MFAEQTLFAPEQSTASGLIRLSRTSVLIGQMGVLVLLSLIALAVNHFFYQYSGVLYCPDGDFLAGINLAIMYGGFLLWQGRDGKMAKIVKETGYYFLIMGFVIFATNAIQYTPFSPIDQHILKIESLVHVNTGALLSWLQANPFFKTVLKYAYGSLAYQLCIVPLMVILIGRQDLIREHYFLLITTVLIGFTFYYFFPTTAPASVIHSDYFSEEQRATSLKFFQVHHYIQPTTTDGGMIALPSFHVIWAWLCLYLLRGWPVAFMVLLPIDILLTASCVLLGWHYFTDVLASVMVILFAHFLYGFIRSREERLGAITCIPSFVEE